jgi:hypothetical protein
MMKTTIIAVSAVFLGLSLARAQPQDDAAFDRSGVYTNKEYRFSIMPPKGFRLLSEAETRKIVTEARKRDKIPEMNPSDPEGPPILQTIFQPSGFDPSMRRLVIIPGYPAWRSIEEFEKNITPDTGDLVYHDRKNLTIKGRTSFLLDREYDFSDFRVRQYCAYVQDYLQQGFMLVFSAASVDFEEYADDFMMSLKSFHVKPPEMPVGMREQKYATRRRAKANPPWREPEVILSLVFVAVFAIWFLVKRLSAGVEEDEEDGAESEEGASPIEYSGDRPSGETADTVEEEPEKKEE